MKLSTLFAGLLCATPTLAQTVTSLVPAPNAAAAPRATSVAVTLSAPAGFGAASGLKVFSAQSEGAKRGATTVAGNAISFAPATLFKPGETVTATLVSGAATPKVWQFTAAATGGSGIFSNGSSLSTPDDTGPTRLADVDGDGDLDLLTFNRTVEFTASATLSIGKVRVHVNNGSGAFTTASTITLPTQSMGGVWDFTPALDIADVDADGDLDILVSAVWAQIYVLANNGAGTFALASTATGGATSSLSVVTGDIDGDGDLDLIATSRGSSSHTFTSTTIASTNDGSGHFTAASNVIVASGLIVKALKDINGDGALDVLGTNDTQTQLYAWLNNGGGNFGAARLLNVAGESINSWTLDDYDGDGDVDLAVVGSASCTGCGATVKIMANNGTGTFSNNGLPAFPYAGQLSSADVDGDGRIDLLLGGYGLSVAPYDTLKVMRNMGGGNFGRPTSNVVFRSNGTIATGDVDGDGDIDFVASTFATAGFPAGATTMLNGLRTATGTAVSAANYTKVWPNPASPTNALHVSLAVPALLATLRLTTILGQVMRTQSITGNNAIVDTNGLATGVYLLTVQADGQAPLT